jgi:NAD(P)-dependent dehydrogenase (short-subunit alcohol dehydrogenase family)
MASQPPNKLASETILIIGGTSGIGYGVASHCLSASATVIISSSSAARIAAAVSMLKASFPGSNIRGYVCDLSKPTVEDDIKALFEKTGPIDHLVYTAADKLATGPLDSVTLESAIAAGHMRFFVPILLAKHARAYLPKSRHASITLTTGSVASRPFKDWVVIGAYAAGMYGLVRGLALDCKPVRVNAVAPGVVDTGLWGSEEERADAMKEMGKATTVGEVGRVEDVVEAFGYLLRDGNCSGTVVESNGGALLV